MERITVTRGLRELKLLNERIDKIISEINFVDAFQGRNPNMTINTKKAKQDFESTCKEKLQSYKDLTARREKIKSAIMKSNSETKIKIGGVEYYIIDAIEKKSNITYEQRLVEKMKVQQKNINAQIDNAKNQLEIQINNLVNQSLGTEKKIDKDAYAQIANPIFEANELKIVDPVNVSKLIEEKEKSLSEFLSEIDYILSESNAKTEIEI